MNKAIVDYYFVELNVEKHFEALRHFLLMEDGEFAQSLSDLLFEKVFALLSLPQYLGCPLYLDAFGLICMGVREWCELESWHVEFFSFVLCQEVCSEGLC